jgi:cysteine desulfurase
MGLSEETAREVIRISFGPSTSERDVDFLLAEWRKLRERRRAA